MRQASKQRLLFFVAQDIDARIEAIVRDFVLKLAEKPWVNGPPRFINSRSDNSNANRGDCPVQTLGGYIEIFSAWPPDKLERQLDIKHFREVQTLVDALKEFTHQHNLAFELELNGTFVGSVTDGVVDRTLSVGLIGEWGRSLGLN